MIEGYPGNGYETISESRRKLDPQKIPERPSDL